MGLDHGFNPLYFTNNYDVSKTSLQHHNVTQCIAFGSRDAMKIVQRKPNSIWIPSISLLYFEGPCHWLMLWNRLVDSNGIRNTSFNLEIEFVSLRTILFFCKHNSLYVPKISIQTLNLESYINALLIVLLVFIFLLYMVPWETTM